MDGGIATLIYVQQFQLVSKKSVTIFTIFVADYFHTLTAEINLLWPARWTVVKALFLMSRYLPFLDGPAALAMSSQHPPSAGVCAKLLKAEIWVAGVGGTCSQLLLVYRGYALAGRTRSSTIALSLLALAVIILGLLYAPLMQRNVVQVTGVNVQASNFTRCSIGETNVNTSRLILGLPIVTIIYETILFGAVYHARAKKYKEDKNWLIKKIYLDALLYYLLLLVISAASLIMWFTTSGPIRNVPVILPRYFSSLISSRIILNIRHYANVQRTSAGTGLSVGSRTTRPVSELRFASGNQTISEVDADLRLY